MIDLTPLEVRKKKGDFRRTMRGYEPALVDDFLDLVADRLDELVRENMALAERAGEQDQQVTEYRERERALTEALVTAQQVREEIRQQTSREADQVRRAAEQEAEALLARAAQEAAELRAAAEREVVGLRSAAEREAAALTGAAASDAAQILSAAEREAAGIVAAAEREAMELRARAAAAPPPIEARSAPHPPAALEADARLQAEEELQRWRERREQFIGSYRAFLARELAELEAAAGFSAAATAAHAPTAAGPRDRAVTAPEPAEPPDTPQQETSYAEPSLQDVTQPDASQEEALPEVPQAVTSQEEEAVPEMPQAATSQQQALPQDTPQPDAPSPAEPAEPSPVAPAEPEEAAVDELLSFEAISFEPLPIETGLTDELALPELDIEPMEPFAPEPYEPYTLEITEALELEPMEPEPLELEPDEGVQPDDAVRAFEAPLPEAEAGAGFERDPIAAAVDEEIAGLTGDVGAAVSPWGLLDEPEPAVETGPELYDGVAEDETADGVPGPIGLTLDVEPTAWTAPPSAEEPPPAPLAGEDADTVESLAGEDATADTVESRAGEDAKDAALDEEMDRLLRNAAAAGYRVPDEEELLLDDVLEEGRPEDSADDDSWLPNLLEDER